MRHNELQIQKSIIKWARCASSVRPELELLHSIPNGQNTTPKNRKNLVLSGLLSGIPDLFLPVARGGFHGLYIELKTETGRLSVIQKKIMKLLSEQGYKTIVSRNSWDAISEIELYIQS